jgi:hypothetical protein
MSVLELAVFTVFFGWVRGVASCPSLPTLSVYPNFSIPFSPRTSYNLDLSICTTTISAD